MLSDLKKIKLTVLFNKQSHLHPLATINQVNKCISILKVSLKLKDQCGVEELKNEAKISSGKIYELAEVGFE